MRKILAILLMGVSTAAFTQNHSYKYLTAKKVFDDLVNAYGNPKAAPSFIILSKTSSRVGAQYVSSTVTIQMDEELYNLCISFQQDSLNALAAILSHELAHYYKDHQWCSDYGYVLRNTALGSKLKSINQNARLEKEGEADVQGLFYAAMAGYYAFSIQQQLLDVIYKAYKIPDVVKGYPTKTERKLLAKSAQGNVARLYQVFTKGIGLLKSLNYDSAIDAFENINQTFPSRENYNNAGTARTLKALALKPLQAREFVYPLEIDAESRLKKKSTRNNDDENEKNYTALLTAAKKDFEKAIALDPKYTKGYINLACVYDLLGNYEGAIGKINELPLDAKSSKEALTVKAIAYYHNDEEEKANLIRQKLNKPIN